MEITHKLTGMLITCLVLLVPGISHADIIMQSDYLVAGEVGDTWTYEDILGNTFTHTLSQIDSGVHAGRFHVGNDTTTGIIYDVNNNAVTWYEVDGESLIPPMAFSESNETGQYYSFGPPASNGSEVIFLTLSSLTVKAGTYDDILVQVWLDSGYTANRFNALLGLDAYGITAAVTDVDWWGRDVGLLAFLGVQAEDGGIDGGYELVRPRLLNPVWYCCF